MWSSGCDSTLEVNVSTKALAFNLLVNHSLNCWSIYGIIQGPQKGLFSGISRSLDYNSQIFGQGRKLLTKTTYESYATTLKIGSSMWTQIHVNPEIHSSPEIK